MAWKINSQNDHSPQIPLPLSGTSCTKLGVIQFKVFSSYPPFQAQISKKLLLKSLPD